jgi:predicted NACHT family NTPase
MSLVGIGTAIGTAISPWLGEWVTVGIAGKLTEGAIKHFKPDEMASLLKQSIAAAEAAQPKTGALFDRCHYDGYKGVKQFLEQFFQSGEVLKELQKPLQDQGKPDLAILIAAFKESAKQHPEAKDYLLNSLPLWMETFVESYFEQIKGICFQVAKAQYLEQLARRVDDVKFVGISVSDSDIEQPEFLAKIFVMPDVREEKRNFFETKTFISYVQPVRLMRIMDGNTGEEISITQIPEQTSNYKTQTLATCNNILEEQKEWATRDRSAPRIPAQKVINLAQKKAVVLGAPGSGKTMLASYFALMLCETAQSDPSQIGLKAEDDYLPVVVRIRDWILQPNMGLLGYLRSNAEANLACKELPTGFFEHWLERGRALILLDGLDEVVDEAQRRKVAEQIETFLHQYKDNPAVITSRPAGYRWDFFNLDEFPHYTLESFDDKQVTTFIDHWYDSRLGHDKEKAQRRKADLLARSLRKKIYSIDCA